MDQQVLSLPKVESFANRFADVRATDLNTDEADSVIALALSVLARRHRRGAVLSSPEATRDYLRLEIGVLEHEVFCVLFLDAQHRIIVLKQMFRVTVTQTSVYPREVVKEALGCNAAAVILAHNHPSGSVELR